MLMGTLWERRDARVGLSRGNQRADFGKPRSLAIRFLSFFAAMPVWGYRGVTNGTPRYVFLKLRNESA